MIGAEQRKEQRRFLRIHRALFGLAHTAHWNILIAEGDAERTEQGHRVLPMAEQWYAEELQRRETP